MVEWGRLEICCTFRGTEGSNPSLSANLRFLYLGNFDAPSAWIIQNPADFVRRKFGSCPKGTAIDLKRTSLCPGWHNLKSPAFADFFAG